MRTNIVINDDLMTEALHLTGIKTKREVVEEALRLLIRTTQQKAVLGLRGKIRWDGDLQEMRQGRFMHESKAAYVTGKADDPATESVQ